MQNPALPCRVLLILVGKEPLATKTRNEVPVNSIQTKLAESWKLRYVGLGFLTSWIVSSWGTLGMLSHGHGYGPLSNPSWLPTAFATAVALVLLSCTKQGRHIVLRRSSALIGGGTAAAGTILAGLAAAFPTTEASSALITISVALLMGGGSALIIVMWAYCYSRLDAEKAEVLIPASFGVALFCLLVFPSDTVSAWVFVSLLPCISAGMLYLSILESPPAAAAPPSENSLPEEDAPATRAGDIVRYFLVVTATYALIWFPQGSESLIIQKSIDLPSYFGTFVGAIVAIGLSTASIFFSIRRTFAEVYRWLTPVIVIGALFLMNDGGVPLLLGHTALTTANFVLTIMMYVSFLDTRYSWHCTGIIFAASCIGACAGSLFASLFTVQDWPLSLGLQILLALFVIATAFLPSDERARLVDRSNCEHNSDMNHPEENTTDTTCRLLSDRFKLTERETDILMLLARGRSQPYIRNEFFLSKNTVASHVKRIYAKLGVHSKQELIDLVESTRSQDKMAPPT